MDIVNQNQNSSPLKLDLAHVSRGSSPSDLNEVAVLLQPEDDVAIARTTLMPGLVVRLPVNSIQQGTADLLEIGQLISAGHKLALRGIAVGAAVRRYGAVIGFATQPIKAGTHVHSHNLAVGTLKQSYEFGTDYQAVELVTSAEQRTFNGFKRPDGRGATRNYIAIIGTVNCSASTIRLIQQKFSSDLLRAYPNIDGVIGLTHKSGCGMRHGGEAVKQLQLTLSGMAKNVNVGAYLLVGLGCETNQIREMLAETGLTDTATSWKQPHLMTIQENHGVWGVVEEATRLITGWLPQVNAVQREPIPISELTIGLQCGGSDSWSGITANPALGFAVDALVRQGGTAILSETPEIYGAEQVLLRRVKNREVGEQLLERFKWWEHYTSINDMELDNNPSPGNKLGGLTTIYEKSLGSVAKGGSTPLNAVYKYAQAVTERGLVFMDTPGYDPVSATGQVAGGANMIVFTTGRGSVFGFKPAPSIKVSSNNTVYTNMEQDIDVNAGSILTGVSPQVVGQQILNEIIAVASGKPSKSEAQGLGEEEFCPWILGATM
jgi:altronate hydrolase